MVFEEEAESFHAALESDKLLIRVKTGEELVNEQSEEIVDLRKVDVVLHEEDEGSSKLVETLFITNAFFFAVVSEQLF